uniref:Uncharacterized protein n=1 Tax=Siphoviridae sp. ctmqi22 TaxID=2827934 RepID=A0A8S5T7F5_9CAUD|nr:MAG TPA: hypothetical protein [Siphoviridae sp. ctmqi22]
MVFQKHRHPLADAVCRHCIFLRNGFRFLCVEFQGCDDILVARDIEQENGNLAQHIRRAIRTQFRKFHVSSLCVRLASFDVDFIRNFCLLRHCEVCRVLKRKLALCLVAGFHLESAGRECVHHVDCDEAALLLAVFVRIVTDDPKIIEIRIGQIKARNDLRRILCVNVRRSNQRLRNGGGHGDKRAAGLRLNGFLTLQFLHILGAVVNVITIIGKRRRSGERDTSGCRAELVSGFERARSRGEIFQNDARIDLELFERIGGDLRKLCHIKSVLSVGCDKFSGDIEIPPFDVWFRIVFNRLTPRIAAFQPNRALVARNKNASHSNSVRDLLCLCIWGCFALGVIPEVYRD